MKVVLKRILLAAYLWVNRTIGPIIEWVAAVFAMGRQTDPVTPVFIIGAPRSGTTLTFQLLVHSFRLGYLTNLHCLFFGTPALVSLFTRSHTEPSDFASDYGRTSGRLGPSECGEWWYRFFPRDPAHVTRADIKPRSLAAFRRSLSTLAAFEKRPLVFKNLYAGMRLDPIVDVFPNAVFIHVERDVRDNALSILEGRMAALGRYDTWWSVPPPGWQDLGKLSPAHQAVSQVRAINACIASDAARLGVSDRVFNATYAAICHNPKAFIAQIKEFATANQVPLELTEDPPSRFEPQGSSTVPADIQDDLNEILRRDPGDNR
tara:strand:+ start:6094 stop:7050 length:957 start_codon:yes stop_codon:yes gene_type:complete